LIVIALRSLQIESGCGVHLLEDPSEWVPYITACWLTSIRDFLDRNNIKIKVTSARLVPTSREHDRYIMDEIRKLGIYDNRQLFNINAVRMHLKVTTLSDVVDAQGKQITEEVFEETKPTDRYSKLKWPRQPVTTTKQRKLWKAALEAAFTSSGRSLQQPLGKWTGPPTQVWWSFYNPWAKRVVTSTTGSTIQFTEHVVSTRKRYRVDATLVAMASPYVSLEDVDWNIMIPATVKRM